MTHVKTAYLPIDRALALSRGETLPETTNGTALFADISGFTPLTEALRNALGERRGGEELTRHLNAVYEALIAEVHRFGGSVIGFSGDAITCWFENRAVENEAESAVRAAAAALAMQNAMSQFSAIPLPDGSTTTLAVKIAIASGVARRFVVGDPAIQLIDVLAGNTIARMAQAESLANRGEILLDETTAQASDQLTVFDWHSNPTSDERFALLRGITGDVAPTQWTDPNSLTLSDELVQAWLLPAINARLDTGQGEFLTELRPAVALFLHFSGLDYETDAQSSQQLDQFVRRVQAICTSYDGILVQLTIGDKGSYLYIAFGAPNAHEDNAERAVNAALALQALPKEFAFLESLQIGISQGVMRTGTYGSTTRRTYGVLGDEVNLAARLMQAAAPGQTLVSSRIQTAVGDAFQFDELAPIRLKGKVDSLIPFALLGAKTSHHLRLQEPTYSLPMIGRTAELNTIAEKIDRVLQGQGQVVGITAEAGMGKSRLVAEVIRLTERRGLHGYGGECQSYGTNSSYLVWQSVWRGLFEIDPSAALSTQQTSLASAIERLVPERLNALPLLGQILNIPLPDNDFTQTLEPRYRKSALEALLLDCIKAAAHQASQQNNALLIVLEDLHWIDPASHDLLEMIARAIPNLPVLIVLAYRPPELQRIAAPRVESLAHFSKIQLAELTPVEAEQLIRAKLRQRLPQSTKELPPALIEAITTRAQGNPFYSEELINFLLDRGLDPFDTAVLKSLEWPTSLHNLILSRIDQLSEAQKTTLKVASIIGRLFKFRWLYGYYPALGASDALKADLDILARLDITPIDTPEPELAYLFKHIVTQEVTYESLAYATRASLHEQFAAFLETQRGDDPDQFLDLLAYHYDHSENLPKRREYLRRAGENAAHRYDNTSAIDYLSRALMVADPADLEERFFLLRTREKVYSIVPNYPIEKQDLDALELLAEQMNDDTKRALVATRRSFYEFLIGDYEASLRSAERASQFARAAHAIEEELTALAMVSRAHRFLGHYQAGLDIALECLRLAQLHERPHAEALAAGAAASTLLQMGNYPEALVYATQGYIIYEKLKNKVNQASTAYSQALAAYHMGDIPNALAFCEKSLALSHETGDRRQISTCLAMLADLTMGQKDYATARVYVDQIISIEHLMGNRRGLALGLSLLSEIYFGQHDFENAIRYRQEALTLYQAIQDKFSVALCYNALCQMHCKLHQVETGRSLLLSSFQLARELNSNMLYLVILGEGTLDWYTETGKLVRAAELVGLIIDHPATPAHVSRQVKERLADVESVLGSQDVAAALQRGKALDLAAVIGEILAELETT